MSDCRLGVSPVNYPDPDPDPYMQIGESDVFIEVVIGPLKSHWFEMRV